MEVTAHDDLGVVTIRHSTPQLALRGAGLLVVGIGVPASVRVVAPDWVALALLATAASALWLVQGLTAVLVLDEDGVAVSASRRGRRHLPWDDVADLTVGNGRIRVATRDGRTIPGPPGDDQVLAAALRDAARLHLLPRRLR